MPEAMPRGHRSGTRRRATVLILAGWAGLMPLAAQEPPGGWGGAEGIRTVFSTSRRFMVSGFTPAAAADLARWAEEVARRMEEFLGPIPLERGWYLELQARPGDRVVRAQGWVDGLLQQRLEIGRDETLDQEDALEGLVWLLLNRWPVIRQDPGDRIRRLAEVPDWLAVGVAQNLYAELRARNGEVVKERWNRDQLTPWPRLVEQEILPAGRWTEKAETAYLVAWLVEQRADLEALWAGCATGRILNAEALAQQVLRRRNVPEATQAWEVWLAAQQDRKRSASGLEGGQAGEFDALTRLETPDLQAVRADVAGPLTLADLVALRKASWVPALATRRGWQIQMAMMGRSPEWQAVAQRYLRFLEGLAGRGPGYSGGLFGRGPSTRQLLVLLQEAESARGQLQADLSARTAYLDALEAPAPPAALSEAERNYLDGVEERLHGEPLRETGAREESP